MLSPDIRNLKVDIFHTIHRVHVDSLYNCTSRIADGIIYYIKGSQTFEYGDNRIEAREGDVLYLPYASTYRNRVFDPATEYYQVDFIVYQGEKKHRYSMHHESFINPIQHGTNH